MERVIYRIYSQNVRIGNYIDYDPMMRTIVLDEQIKQSGKTSNRLQGIRSRSKNLKAFTKTPKDCKVVEIVLPKGKKNVTLAFPIHGGMAEEYLDISTKPSLWLEDGRAISADLVAKPAGFARINIRIFTDAVEKDEHRTKSYRFVEKNQDLGYER